MPSSLEAEEGVVSCLFRDPKGLIPGALADMPPGVFHHFAVRTVFEAVCAVFEKKSACDLLLVTQALMDAGKLDDAGGAGEVTRLATLEPDTANYAHYVAILREKHKLREAVGIAQRMLGAIHGPDCQWRTVLEEASGALMDLQREGSQDRLRSAKTVAMEAMQELEGRMSSRGSVTKGLPTGLAEIDRALQGLSPGDLVTIAATPGSGKSSLALNIVAHITGLNPQAGVMMFPMEMPDRDVMIRGLMCGAGVNLTKAHTGMFSEGELKRVLQSGAQWASRRVWFDDSPSVTHHHIMARCRQVASQCPLDLVVVDHLHRMAGRPGQEDQWAIAENVQGLKNLALELRVPVLLLCQLKKIERPGGRPTVGDLKGTNKIYEESDKILLLHRPRYWAMQNGKKGEDGEPLEDDGICEVNIAKNRNGPVGEVKVKFLGEFTKFGDLEGDRMYG
ncbi:MAG: DnaB-like helicase C-terminal domain-containing protein [Verrucomicrobiota bacterium]